MTDVKALALNYTAIDENGLLTTIVNWLCGVILVTGVLYGGYELAQGFMDDQPARKKQGITALIVGITVAAVIYTVMQTVLAS